MRAALVRWHRWFGLAAAAFLFVAGLTGAVISWDHELDAWLNPQFYRAPGAGAARPALELARTVEAADPRVRVSYLPLHTRTGEAVLMSVVPRMMIGSGRLSVLDFNQVAVDPVNGQVLARRLWGAVSLSRENLLPFLYKLHYSMHLPDAGPVRIGILFMGIIGLLWVIDCLAALLLSFPTRSAWRKSFGFRWRRGGAALTYDTHRSGGVWIWLALLIIAVTSVGMNLEDEIMRPVVARFSTLTASPTELIEPQAIERAPEPGIDAAQAVQMAQADARRRGWRTPPGGLFYSPEYSLYGVGFFHAGSEHGDGGLGNAWLYLDASSGRILTATQPGAGSAGDVFMQAQFPLHSGRIAGLPGRIFVSVLGLAVAGLSATGVYLWMRKQRRRHRARTNGFAPESAIDAGPADAALH